MTGPLEPSNEPYAIAKIAGVRLCQAYRSRYGCNFISAMPTNLYGPGDNFDLDGAHVLPALIRKFQRRTGEDLTIRELAEIVKDIVCPTATLTFDLSKPDGTPRKLLDVGRLHALGWRHRVPLKIGIKQTYEWYIAALADPERRVRGLQSTLPAVGSDMT